MDKTTLLNISKNMQDLTFVLANKNYDKLGALSNVDQNTVVYKKTMHGMELSFDVYKELDGVQEKLWYELTDFKLVWVKEINEYFQITVSTDELSYTKKIVTATSLCEAELSQVYLYNIEINTEDDIARDDYKVTTFYNMDDPEASLIHRILSKVPQYTIKHIDSSLSKIQRSFSIDGTSILDFLNGECSEQFNCLFTFDSTDRSVSVYDLYTVCEECDERDDMSNFTHIDENGSLTYTCPKCGSHNVKYYGEDTKIFVDNENLTDEVRLETDTDSVKNCFKLVAGDDLMTTTIRLLNMNGSDYIYYVSDDQKKDMPKELVDRIESYDELCASYNTEYESLVSQIYEASSKLYYYKNTMMPTIEQSTVTAATEAAKLTTQNLSPLGLSSVSTSTSKSTVESALKNYAKVYVKSGYVKLEINDSNYSYVGTDSAGNHYGTWTGNFKVTNYSDETDIAYSSTITVKVYDNYQDFIEQKVKKTILNDADDDDSIFDVLSIDNLDNFKEALTYYCLNRLKSFYDATQSAIDVLVQMNQGVQDAVTYSSLYVPYYNKLQACQAEIDKRQVNVDEWQAKYDSAVSRQQEIQKILNFEDYIGKDLYKLFCCYRREDTYQNDNYISDGLEDQEVIERAKEFLEVAKKELVKSATMQHSISTTLYNLLLIPEFKLILNSFEVGNWIRVRVDGNVYKLRLIQYEISFSNMNTISVEFSDVTKIRDSLTDFQSLVKDTQSISSSYSYISKQADAGHKASVNMDKIVEDGLNSALVNIKNNDREEITYDKHGILCREYDDISDDYSDEQLLITHNILAFTDDNWQTSSLGLGKHEFIRYDGNKFVKDVGYGLSAKFSQNMYSYAGQIIGGDIFSENYSSTAGTHIGLNKGNFSFAGGKFSYDPDKDKMIIRDVTIEWSTSTPPEISDISGLEHNLNDMSATISQTAEQIQSEVTRAQGAESALQSSITQTADAITAEVTRAQGAESALQSSITQTADAITAEVTRAQGAESALQSSITQTADAITAEVTRAQGAESALQSSITQTAESITAEVSRAQLAEGQLDASLSLKLGRDENNQVVSMINASADKIKLTGNRLIVECNNFELDSDGRVHIIDSLLFNSGDATGIEIIGHDGKHNALLKNINLDIESVTTPDGFTLATKDDIPDIPDMTNYVTKTDISGFAENGSSSCYGYSSDYTGYLVVTSNIKRIATTNNALSVRSTNGIMSIPASSDTKLKHDVSDSKINAINKIMQIIHKEFYWNDSNEFQDNGYIAQELKLIDPSMVISNIDDDGTEWLSVNTVYMVSICTKAIQEQQKEIEQLKQENLALQNRLTILEQKMEVLYNAYNNKNN